VNDQQRQTRLPILQYNLIINGNMVIDEARFEQRYDLLKLKVLSSSQISSRIASVISKITQPKAAKPTIIILSARANVANKLISIVEIAKRELASQNVKFFQYNALTSELIDIPRDSRKKTSGSNVRAEGEEDEQSDDAFETTGVPTSATKKRSVPVMTVYLATAPVKELKAQFGYAEPGMIPR